VIVPVLFDLYENKNITVAQASNGVPIVFRRWLFQELRVIWEKVWQDASNFHLNNTPDDVVWNLEKSGRFTGKSVYDGLTRTECGIYHKRIWKGKIPAKIKIFLWLISFDAVLTKDNLCKRKWQGDPSCVFCDSKETISHLFFQCPVARVIWLIIAKCFRASNMPTNLQQCWRWCETWRPFGKKYHPWGVAVVCWAIWKCRNKACFEGKLINNPLEIICHANALMIYWAGLYAEMDREQLIEGANLMLKVAKEVLAAQTARQSEQVVTSRWPGRRH